MRQPLSSNRLIGWASIGGYIGRDARTAQRYERDRGLPVRRMPGEGRSTVFALSAELDQWLLRHGAGSAQLPDSPPVDPGPSPPPSSPVVPVAAARLSAPRAVGAIALAVVSLFGLCGATVYWLGAARADRPPPPTSAAYDQQGAAAFSERTPDGLARAIDDYTQAVVRDPADAAAYVGLANSYNLAPQVMGAAPAQTYPHAQAAAERALLLAPSSAEAHRALAFSAFWWGEDARRGEAEFRRALALDPGSALTHQWYATALAERGDRRALDEINRALEIAPSPAMMIDKGWILTGLGRQAEAENVLDEAVRLEPDCAIAHSQLGHLLKLRGDTAGWLREERRAAELRHDDQETAVLAQAQAVGTRGKGEAVMRFLADRQAELVAAGHGQAILAAVASSELRRHDDTLRFLAVMKEERDPALMGLHNNPDFAWLRNDPRFLALAP